MNEELEKYYSGDNGWYDFVNLAKSLSTPPPTELKQLTEELEGHDDIAAVVYYRFLDDGIRWIHRKVPALAYLTPVECLRSPTLQKRLKEGLMRMP